MIRYKFFLSVLLAIILSSNQLKANLLQATIINKSTNKTVFLYHNDIFNKANNFFLSPDTTLNIEFDDNLLTPLLVIIPVSNFKMLGLAILPGDTVRIKYNEKTNNYDLDSDNATELTFSKELLESKFNLNGPYDQVPYSNRIKFEYFLDEWHKVRLQSENFINRLRLAPKVRSEVFAFFEREIRLRVFSILLIPVILQKPQEPLRLLPKFYQDTVQAHAKRLRISQGLLENSSENLMYAQRSYAIFLAVNLGKYGTIPEQYQIIKKEFSGYQREWTCYSILRDCQRDSYYGVSAMIKDYQSWVNPDSKFLKELLIAEKLNKVAILKEFSLNDRLNTQDNNTTWLFDIIKKYKGKVIYMDFWASWCKPCLEELPVSAEIREQYKYRNLAIIYLSVDEDQEKWQNASNRFLWNVSENYRLGNEDESGLVNRFKIKGIPRYMIIDKEGIVRYANAPPPSDSKLREILDKLLL